MIDYGFKIRLLRDRLKLTQKEMSDLLKLNIETVRRWEQNKKKPNSKNKIIIDFLIRSGDRIIIIK